MNDVTARGEASQKLNRPTFAYLTVNFYVLNIQQSQSACYRLLTDAEMHPPHPLTPPLKPRPRLGLARPISKSDKANIFQ